MTHYKIIIITVLAFFISKANIISQTNNNKIADYEISIQNLFDSIIKSSIDEKRVKLNAEILDLFEKALNEKNSFQYKFDKLVNISKLNSSDNQIKIISWNLPFSDGTYKYFGFIQYLKKKSNVTLTLKLNDKSDEISSPEKETLTNENWYGALYYKLLTNSYKNKTYYTLLAWDGNDDFTNKKIIDVLYIKNKKAYFGQAIFKTDNTSSKRIVFEYTKQAKMMLKYDEKLKLIVFDHLSPSQKKFEGQFIYYGPDMTQDGLEFKDGFWILKSNLDLRNSEPENKGKPIETSF
ncbi:MAG: hypothetical protein JXR51_04055 [Bacteroidales bacterium]|nr:hypothetical protein [Bacteroidales bacterium]